MHDLEVLTGTHARKARREDASIADAADQFGRYDAANPRQRRRGQARPASSSEIINRSPRLAKIR
jgi:hypothetical protein